MLEHDEASSQSAGSPKQLIFCSKCYTRNRYISPPTGAQGHRRPGFNFCEGMSLTNTVKG